MKRIGVTTCFFVLVSLLSFHGWSMSPPPGESASMVNSTSESLPNSFDALSRKSGSTFSQYEPPVQENSGSNQQESDSSMRCPKTLQELIPHQHPAHGSLIGFYEKDYGWRVGYVWSHAYCIQRHLRGKELFPAKHQDRVPNQSYEDRYSYYPMNQDGTFQDKLNTTQSIVFSTGTTDLRDEKTSGIIYQLRWPYTSNVKQEVPVRVSLSAFKTFEGIVKYVFMPPNKVQIHANDIDIPAYLYLVEVTDIETKQVSYQLVPSNLTTKIMR